MNFDQVIIGGGLAGLICGLRLQQAGNRCAIVSFGQSAMEFSSGALDLLSHLPNGEEVVDIKTGLEELAEQAPTHPYSLVGKDAVLKHAQFFAEWYSQLGLDLQGEDLKNQGRITPLGTLRPTWLLPSSCPSLVGGISDYPYRKILLLGIEGFHDFQPHLIATQLQQQPAFTQSHICWDYIRLPECENAHINRREWRSVHMARLQERQANLESLAQSIKAVVADAEVVFLPACWGFKQTLLPQLEELVGCPLYELPTLPPSLMGLRQHQQLEECFQKQGGVVMKGDCVLRAEFNANRITQLWTREHEDIPLKAEQFVLATGSFFSNGLRAEFERIIEPIFQADVTFCSTRADWTDKSFHLPQAYHQFGVRVNSQCQMLKQGKVVENGYAIGSILADYDGIAQGCGSGVAIVTALQAATHILSGGQ